MARINFERANLLRRVREEYWLYGVSHPAPKNCPPSYGPLPGKLHYRGSFEKLAEAAARTGMDGMWSRSGRVRVYRTEEGGVMNWAPRSGTIWFQGKRPYLDDLAAAITREMARMGLQLKGRSGSRHKH